MNGVPWASTLLEASLTQVDINSSPPFQLPTPSLPHLRETVALGSTNLQSASRLVDPTSPTRGSSPNLPPLPRLSRTAFVRSAQVSSPTQHQSDSTYYTALWGSPYELSSSSRASQSHTASHRRNSDLVADGSPLRYSNARAHENGKLGSKSGRFIRRSNTADEVSSSPFRDSEKSQFKQRNYDLTGDWIRNYKQERIERRTWLSDESEGSGDSGESDSEGAVEGTKQVNVEVDLKTPKASQLNRYTLQDRPTNVSTGGLLKKHRAHVDRGTLTQQDFDALLKTNSEIATKSSKMLSAMMSGIRRTSSISEKPLPTTPLNRTASESPVITTQNAGPDRPNLPKKPSISSTASFQHPKKKFQWRGKIGTIALPLDVGRDADGKPRIPLSPEEVAVRMRRWEQQGFSNRGFDLGEDSSGIAAMSRDVYPDHSEYRSEIQSRKFQVKIPNKKAFEDYVSELNEDVLRALGVTKKDQPVGASPGVAAMSRQASSQNSLAPSLSSGLSAPGPFRGQTDKTFSPPLTAPNPQFPFTQPIVSPGSMPQNPRSAGFHPNQPMVFQPGQIPKPGGSFASQQAPSLPGPLPQQPYLGSAPGSRGVSPLIDGRRQSIMVSNSPVSPLPEMGADGYFNNLASLPPHLRQQVGQMHPSLVQQQAPQQPKPLQRQVSESLNQQQPIKYISQPDIASPMPQGHRQNLSETLQKEIDEAEYHLEASIARQLEDEDGTPSKEKRMGATPTEKREAIPEEETVDIKANASDIETNPSLGSSPMPKSAELPLFSARTPKPANSKLNVNAQEFVFDPSKPSFTPIFAFGEQSTPFSGPTSATSTSGVDGLHSKTTSNASTFSSGLNVAAPAFVPGKVQMQPPPASNRVFSFSSSLPGPKPSGLSSTPGYAFNSGSVDESEKKAPTPRIFSDIVPPAKKSKAVPIIQPKGELEDHEDESGRVARSKDREKRVRRGGGSGDQIPLFAEIPTTPSVPLVKEDNVRIGDEKAEQTEQLPDPQDISKEDNVKEKGEPSPKLQIPTISAPEAATLVSPAEKTEDGPLNTADFLDAPTNPASPSSPIGKATDELKAMVDDIAVSDEVRSDEGPKVQGPIEDPFTVGDHEDDGPTDKSRPHSRPVSPSFGFVDEKSDSLPNGTALAPKSEISSRVGSPIKKSSLSTTAKSFAFNPAASAFRYAEPSVESVGNTPIEAPSIERTVMKPPTAGGLGAPRYAIQEPAKQIKELTPSPVSHIPTPELSESPLKEQIIQSVPVNTNDEAQESDREPSPDISPKAKLPMRSRSNSPKQALDERIIDGVQYVEPASYQEIDDVMQQLNGDDSDAGVERNPVEAWCSPVRRATDEHKSAASEHHIPREYMSDADRRMLRSPLRVTSSPNRLKQPFQYLPSQDYGSSDSATRSALAEIAAREARYSPSFKKPRRPSVSIDSPIRKLNRASDCSPSVWDDIVSSGEEEAFNARVGFFNNRVNHVVANAIDGRLQPLESTLAALTAELARRSNRSRSRRFQRSASEDAKNSDADDEDDEAIPGRAISPLMKDRKFEKLRSLLLEVVNSQRPAPVQDTKVLETLAELKADINQQKQEPAPSKNEMGNDAISRITEAIGEIKNSLAGQSPQSMAHGSISSEALSDMTKAIAQLRASMNERKGGTELPQDIKTVVEEAINKHMRGKSAPVKSSQESAAVEKLNLQVAGLESMLKVQESRAEDEYKLRRQVEDRLAEAQRELKTAIAETNEHRDIAEQTESSLRSFLDEQQRNKQHTATLEEVQIAMEKNVSELTEKNIALEETISEYRISHDNWRSEMDEAKTTNEDLQRTMSSLREELEDGIKSRQTLKSKFERLQEELTEAARNIASDQASWRHKEEEHKAKHELSSARLEAEARTRERLELEIERLEKQEREAMKARFLVEQVRNENSSLSAIVNDLRTKSHQQQERSMAYERELHDTKERSHLEMERISALTKGSVEAANQQVQIVKSKLEGSIERLETQLENAKNEANLSKERHELMLEEASASRDTALREAAEAREAALQEHYRFHERTLDETQTSHNRALNDLKTSHERALENAADDHKRAISNLVEDHKRKLHAAAEDRRINEQDLKARQGLSDEKILHLQDMVKSLEERLDIAKSAAQAAAEAARSVRTSTPQPASHSASRSAMPSMPVTRNSEIPDKISPQALRESILVLQEQLHERESRIEKLEQELGEVDHEAPSKIKDRDIEIGWLRELLGVRLDDLQDIITSLSSPTFDREAVRDAVIRLRANLQMEQQEKERAMAAAGGARIPTLSSLATSPRSLPMAAAAAWGNWRKGQGSLSSLAEMAVPSVNSSANQTPSRSSPQSFLSGLLTPPNTNVRHSPQQRPGVSNSRPQSSSSRRPLGGYSTPKRQLSSSGYDARRPLSKGGLVPPESPSLLRNASYDADASEASHHYSLDRYVTDPPAEGEEIEEVSEADETAGPVLHKGKGRDIGEREEKGGTSQADGPQELFGPSIELES